MSQAFLNREFIFRAFLRKMPLFLEYARIETHISTIPMISVHRHWDNSFWLHINHIRRNNLMKRNTLKEIIRYKFDNFMSKGGSSIFFSLLIIFIGLQLIIGLLRGLSYSLFPEAISQNAKDFLTNFFITFLQLTDPGNMAQDITSSYIFKISAIIAGLAGVIMFSALIAFITNALDRKISRLKKGFSKVIESDHTVILGWDEQRILEILRELIIANESEKKPCVLILSETDKEKMDDFLSVNLGDIKNTRIVTRSGNTSSLVSMNIISIDTCKSVIVLSRCSENASFKEKSASDANVIKSVLAVVAFCNRTEKHSIVAEVFDPELRKVVTNISPSEITVVNSNDLLGKVIVQTSRSNGLSIVYTEMFSFAGCEVYFYKNKWNNAKFGDLAYCFKDGIPLGICDRHGDIILNPHIETKMDNDQSIIILANDDSNIKLEDTPIVSPDSYAPSSAKNSLRIEKELLLGWTSKAKIILDEYADYLLDNSIIDIVVSELTPKISKEIQTIKSKHKRIEISVWEKNVIRIEDLISLNPMQYNNIIILSPDSATSESADARNISILLQLRSLFDKMEKQQEIKTKIITEVSDSKNMELIAYTGVNDLIISNRLISMMLAQISENKKIYGLYDQLLKETGSEIYIKPIELYFQSIPQQLKFADIIYAAQKRNEICIGIKIKALEKDFDANFGIEINPSKTKIFELQKGDSLVALSENEV